MLYIRMFIIMAITLYTSRVILITLGVIDYGIYNIVAGVVVLFSFLNAAMTAASQRYLSVAIGEGNDSQIQKVFSTSLISHLILIAIVVILAETIGLWFVKSQLIIPETRKSAAIITYHIAIATTCINILRVPFNASIIAHEKMGFYAYISIIDVTLKLTIVWLLQFSHFDKLILYSFLLLIATICINIAYAIYCHIYFRSQKIIFKAEKSLLKEMTIFSGWNVFGGIADVGYKQGTNIILNIFYGVALNAVMGITNQIRVAVYTFISNLQTAANPQIIKSYATNDMHHFKTLVCGISKYSYFLMLILAIPIFLNMDFILTLWLKNPPPHSTNFAQLILIFCLVDSLSGPLWTSMQATGKIKNYLLITSFCLLLNLPIAYFALWIGSKPESIIIIQIFVTILTLIIRLIFAKKIGITFKTYMTMVIAPILIVSICSIPIPSIISMGLIGWEKLISTCIASIICTSAFIYVFGISKKERQIITTFIKSKFKR